MRIVEVRTYEYDHADFADDYYVEHGADTDQKRLELDKADIEGNRTTPDFFDPRPYITRAFSLIIE